MSEIVIEIVKGLVAIMFLLGSIFMLLTSFGIIRLPDVYNRSHAATKAGTLGIMSILTGAFVYFWVVEGVVSAKLILGIIFVLVTMPVGGHLVGRAAYRTNVPLWEKSVQDDLREVRKNNS